MELGQTVILMVPGRVGISLPAIPTPNELCTFWGATGADLHQIGKFAGNHWINPAIRSADAIALAFV
jgi:hypothetical protein